MGDVPGWAIPLIRDVASIKQEMVDLKETLNHRNNSWRKLAGLAILAGAGSSGLIQFLAKLGVL